MPASTHRTAARRLRIRDLLARRTVVSQEELLRLLARHGHRVTQTTVSRDLRALGAHKSGEGHYVVGGNGAGSGAGTLAERLRQFAVGITASANIVVIHTPPGSAHSVGVALDAARTQILGVVGCVAGDDTLLAVTSAARGGAALARRLRRLMEA